QERAPDRDALENRLEAPSPVAVRQEGREEPEALPGEPREAGLVHRAKDGTAPHAGDSSIAFPGHARRDRDLEVEKRVPAVRLEEEDAPPGPQDAPDPAEAGG